MELGTLGRAEYSLLETHVLPPMVGRDKIARILGYRENAGVPSAVVPLFIGETLFDTVGLDFYDAYGTAAGEFSPRSFNTLTLTELAYLDGATTTQTANKVIVNDANVNQGIAKVTQLHIGTSGAETQLTATAAQLNRTAITTPGTAEASKTLVLGATKNIDTIDVAQGGLKANGVVTSSLVRSTVTVTAAALDAAGSVNVVAGVAGDQYKVVDVILVGGGTNFGAGGDRLISLTDGTTVYTTIANADIEAAPAASLRLGDVKVPFLTGTIDTATASAAALRFQYSGGTTDHGGVGSIKFIVTLEKVA